jgi:ketosteroid isomerase-like protein
MSENLDLVRSIYAEWERGDYPPGDWAAPDIEWLRVDGPEPGTRRGAASINRRLQEFTDAWRDLRTVAEEYRELDGDRVLVFDTFDGRGKSSGLDIRNPGAVVFYIRAGKVRRLETYWHRDRALADLGLTE